ncbi:Auxin efflux carrier component 1 [Acorus calamus]|uniref:Auxin efflux carrier component 1 n=1 Tax=Acorus calamus TaxID=4465 RepID=A0AAV9ELH4_ACOCL|nr:Auxin efflux carrier component 1 [Acorus calamus]
MEDGTKDLHMFVWSSSASPVSDVFGGANKSKLKDSLEMDRRSMLWRGMSSASETERTVRLGSAREEGWGWRRRKGDAADERDDEVDPYHGLEEAHPQSQHLL